MKRAWIVLAFGLSVASMAYAQRSPRRSPSTPTNRWEVDTSGMTDQPSLTLRLEAINPGMLRNRAVLIVRCLERDLVAYISTGLVLPEEGDAKPVRVRWGTAVAQETSWNPSPDYSVVLVPEPRPFLKQLLATPDLRLEGGIREGPSIAEPGVRPAGKELRSGRPVPACAGSRSRRPSVGQPADRFQHQKGSTPQMRP